MNTVQSLYNWYRSIIRNPKYRWWVILGTLVYLFSPIDVAPDFIPIIGQIDDVVLMTLLVSEVSQMLIDRVKTKQEQVVADTNTTKADSVDVDAVRIN